MVKIRLKKLGHTHNSFFRVIVSDSRSPRNGRFIDELGYYNPYKEPSEIKLNEESCKKWLSNGAKPTDRVAKLFKAAGITK